jgi:protein TonB
LAWSPSATPARFGDPAGDEQFDSRARSTRSSDVDAIDPGLVAAVEFDIAPVQPTVQFEVVAEAPLAEGFSSSVAVPWGGGGRALAARSSGAAGGGSAEGAGSGGAVALGTPDGIPGGSPAGEGAGGAGSGGAPRAAVEVPAALLESPSPSYPLASRRLNEEGTVTVRIHVAPDGAVAEVQLVESCGFSRLDEAAVEALRSWLFRPATRDGAAVEWWILHRVTFRLQKSS